MTAAEPAGLAPALAAVPLVCPRCRGPLGADGTAFRCDLCARTFPVVAGIPDFRLEPDPYLPVEEDLARTGVVLEALDRLALRPLLEHYWSYSDVTPPDLRPVYVESALRGDVRARRLLDVLETAGPRRADRPVLEIGSGTGNLLAVAGKEGVPIVGVDVAMRWLHLSRRRFRDLGLPEPPLVCAGGEALPFPDGSFSGAVSIATLEFTRRPADVTAEAARVLLSGAPFALNTVNRYSLAPEPHVGLLGVGFLPRRLQARYVRFRRDASFEHVTLLSLRELRRLGRHGFATVDVRLPRLSPAAEAALPARLRNVAGLYRRVAASSVLSALAAPVAPEWDVLLVKA